MILIKNCSYVLACADKVLNNVDILIKDNKIEKIDRNISQEGCKKVISGLNKLVAPGLINCHTHGYQNLLKGLGDTLTTFDWCRAVTFPFVNIIHKYEREYDDESLSYAWGILMAIEMIKNGITTFVSMDNGLKPQFDAWEEVGIRGRLAINTVNRWIPKEFAIPDEVRVAQMEETIEKCHNKGLQDVMLGPNTSFSCTEPFMRDIQKMGRKYGIRSQVHVSETANEVPDSIAEVGMPPLKYLDSIGFLEDPIMAVHCVHLTPEEIDICAEKNVSVVYNPKSNGKLGSGIAPIAEMYENGVNVCLATDGAASNDLQDLMEDMRFGSMLQKLKYGTPARFGEKEMFKIATEGGAKAIGLDAGVLQEGKLADIIIMDAMSVNLAPVHEPISNFVYCGKGSDVETVIIDGKVVMEDKVIKGVDEKAVVKEAIDLGNLRYSEVPKKAMKTEF
jgi:5-methylthioadenosine/S-adenosylhomocysteine deaminase